MLFMVTMVGVGQADKKKNPWRLVTYCNAYRHGHWWTCLHTLAVQH